MLFVIPNFIDQNSAFNSVFPAYNLEVIAEIKHFAVENIKVARRSLKRMHRDLNLSDCSFYCIGKKATQEDLIECREVLKQGIKLGLLSDSGMPGIADPGQELILMAHEMRLPVKVLIGPSSLFMALAASGLNGQKFSFHGYLDRDQKLLGSQIKRLEAESRKENCTQMFIETPYRNEKLFNQLIHQLSNDTLLCLAVDIGGQAEFIRSSSVNEWKKKSAPELKDHNCVFLFLSI